MTADHYEEWLELGAAVQAGPTEIERQALKPPPRRRRGTTVQLHNFTMRVSIYDAAAFILYCESERIPYREAFARMLAAVQSRNEANQ